MSQFDSRPVLHAGAVEFARRDNETGWRAPDGR